MSNSRIEQAGKGPRNFSKSRNGCPWCKSHRRKCDEAKPACTNCTSRGLVCEGYAKSLKWSTKHEVYKPKRHRTVKDIQSTPTKHFILEQERRPIHTELFEAASPASFTELVVETPPSLPNDDCSQILGFPGLPVQENDRSLPELASQTNTISDTQFRPISVDSLVLTPSSCRIRPKHLLRRYYQIRENQKSQTQTPSPRLLMPEGSMLVEHYFRDICNIYSLFDSNLNPFRMSVARSWTNSAPIYYAIQSMAAAHLSNSYSSMESTGIEMKRLADSALRDELSLYQSGQKSSDCALLVTLLLGLSAAWHNRRDLGSQYLRIARTLMYPRLIQDHGKSLEAERQDQFFEEALIYWEMITAFVSSPTNMDPLSLDYGSELPTTSNLDLPQPDIDNLSAEEKLLPHPWTGVGPRVQMLYAEAAQLIRKERIALPDQYLVGGLTDGVARQAMASNLEEQLLAIELPLVSDLVDPGDLNCSKHDYIAMAEATRCAALLEIYRVFPDILRKRSGVLPFNPNDSTFTFGPDWQFASAEADMRSTAFLTSLSLHIIDIITKIPNSAGTAFFQIMLLMVAGCELRFGKSAANIKPVNLDFLDMSPECLQIITTRNFVEERMASLAVRLPEKPVRVMAQIINEVWRRMDLGEDVFWLDVMIANNWETVLG